MVVKPNDRYVFKSGPYYARFMFSDAGVRKSVTSWHDTLRVMCYVEVSTKPWLKDADIIGSSIRIGSISAEVFFNISFDHPPTMADALWFACKELNPMLESMTTLKGIEHNVDIIVEHGLRPTKHFLQNLVQPAPKHSITQRTLR